MTRDGPHRNWLPALGQGGEIALWESTDGGANWNKVRDLTTGSPRNHGYVRRVVNAHPDFYGFWSDGNTGSLSECHPYFTNRDGTVIKELPYTMTEDWEAPTDR